MDKLLEMLGVKKLEEAEAATIKEKLETLIEIKAKELSESQLKEEKEKLIETYEEKFEQYKEDITGKFSNFVDEILEQEMTIPDRILEYARKGELYSDLIEQFKIRLGVDEGLLDEEVKSLLGEAKQEIVNLRDQLDSKISENLEVKADAQELAAGLYLREKCDGLVQSQKKSVLSMLEGITDREEIDRKFSVIVESLKIDEMEDEGSKKDEMEDEEEEKKKKKEKEMKKEEGTGLVDVAGEVIKEEKTDPFENLTKQYVQILRENKF